jgi:F-type H+-transporting ATPase subunit delta
MITALQYAQALHGAIQETNPKDHDKVLDNFVKVLSENGDIGKYQEIEKEYQSLQAKEQGIEEVTVVTAQEMPNAKHMISELNELVGKRLKVNQEVDPSLIGGMVIRAGDTLIDASVKRQLIELEKTIREQT